MTVNARSPRHNEAMRCGHGWHSTQAAREPGPLSANGAQCRRRWARCTIVIALVIVQATPAAAQKIVASNASP
jgi:hypothetical protein